jgi:hypothetical protein
MISPPREGFCASRWPQLAGRKVPETNIQIGLASIAKACENL